MSHQGYQHISAKDVVHVKRYVQSKTLFKEDTTLRGSDLLDKVQRICINSGQFSAEEIKLLFGNGLQCEVLSPGATDWQSGQLKFSLGVETQSAERRQAPAPNNQATHNTPTPSISSPPPAPKATQTSAIKAEVNREPAPEPELELNLDNFTNAGDPSILGTHDDVEINGDDLFALMDDEDAEPLDSGFFNTSAEEIEAFDLDTDTGEASSEPIASPWDVDELDNMLMAK